MVKDRRILLGVSGSIASYKAAEIASQLTQAGGQVAGQGCLSLAHHGADHHRNLCVFEMSAPEQHDARRVDRLEQRSLPDVGLGNRRRRVVADGVMTWNVGKRTQNWKLQARDDFVQAIGMGFLSGFGLSSGFHPTSVFGTLGAAAVTRILSYGALGGKPNVPSPE